MARSTRAPSGNSPGPHAAEQIKVLLHASIPVGAVFAGFGEGAPVLPGLLCAQVAHIGQAFFDELLGELVGLLEVVGCVVHPVFPVKAEPAHILHDGVDVLLVLLTRVGVVETQVADAIVVGCNAEVQTDGLGVADVQVAVWFRWEAGVHPAVVLECPHVLIDDGTDEVYGLRCAWCRLSGDVIV